MSGYTPVFDTVFEGSLCGRWPALAVWLTILPMTDKDGNIDMTYHAMAVLTGWPIELLRQGIEQLCESDPESRSVESGGRRLELIDPEHRQWGWRVINHAKYREKARLMGKTQAEVESGKNAQRMRDRRSPPKTAADPLSDSYADTYSNTSQSAPVARNCEQPVDKSDAEQQRPYTVARQVWIELTSSGGKRPPRDAHVQAAIDSTGGWPRIRERTEFDSAKIQREFCQAYVEWKPP